MTPKLILIDLDGTLLTHEKTLSPGNRAALERAARAGAEIVIATGRIYQAIPEELRALPFLRYFILMNGAKVWDRKEDRVLYQAEIPLATAERIFDDVKPLRVTVDCYQNDRGLMDRYYLDHLEEYIHDPQSIRLVRRTRLACDDFLGAVRAGGPTVQKVQCFFADVGERPQIKSWLQQRYPDLVFSLSMPENMEINAPTATKGAALLALCGVIGIPVECSAAFGDATNDLDMLRTAGVGVAMANASPEAKAAADRLTLEDNQHDGVGHTLDGWFA